jgi:zinc D-Ala-D-Ala carboxypeptidase
VQLSKHFSLAELTVSRAAAQRGWSNAPNEVQTERLRLLCVRILQPLRDHLRVPIVVTSGFRTAKVNRKIGGASNSQHLDGDAADIHVPGMSIDRLVDHIRMLHLPFDQMIDEFGQWVHISHTNTPRREELQCRFVAGRRTYTPLGD